MHNTFLTGVSLLADWHYMIYEIPLFIGGLFMVITAIRPHGHHVAGHGHMGDHVAVHMPAHAPVPAGGHPAPAAHAAAPSAHGAHAQTHAHTSAGPAENRDALWYLGVIFGFRDAPVALVVDAGMMGWGVFGFWATTVFFHTPEPIATLAPLAIAAGCGFGAMHVSGRIFARFLPKDETDVVSRNGLFGLTGTVVYPVTSSAGRVHIYDPYGTLHDESCRVASGADSIARGAKVLVTDMDEAGRIIVEEIA